MLEMLTPDQSKGRDGAGDGLGDGSGDGLGDGANAHDDAERALLTEQELQRQEQKPPSWLVPCRNRHQYLILVEDAAQSHHT